MNDVIDNEDVEIKGQREFYEKVLKAVDEVLPQQKEAREREQEERAQRQREEAARQREAAKDRAYDDYRRTAGFFGLPTDTESALNYSQKHYKNYQKEGR